MACPHRLTVTDRVALAVPPAVVIRTVMRAFRDERRFSDFRIVRRDEMERRSRTLALPFASAFPVADLKALPPIVPVARIVHA